MLSNNFIHKLFKYLKRDFFSTFIYVVRYKFIFQFNYAYSTLILRIESYFLNVNLGSDAKILGKFYFNKFPLSTIVIGNGFKSINTLNISGMSYSGRSLIKTFSPTARLFIGDRVELNSSSILVNSCQVFIDDDVIIAPNCTIMDSNFHSISRHSRSIRNPLDDSDIYIGKNVWIGLNSTIMKGTKIGDNSIIAAGSIVSGNIPPNSIYKSRRIKCIKSSSI